MGVGDLPRAEEARCTTPATTPTSATRAASRPTSQSADEALAFIMKAIEKAGYKPGEDVVLALDPRLDRVLQGRQVRAGRRGQDARCRPAWSTIYADLVGALPDRLDRGRHGRGRLGRLEGADRRARRARCSSSATTSSSPTPSACADGIEQGRRQRDPGQGQPDRHADRDAGRRRDGAPRRLHAR